MNGNDAAEIKIRAERRLGEMLAETVTAGNPQFRHHDDGIGKLPQDVDENQSRRWQTIARLPDERFEAWRRPR